MSGFQSKSLSDNRKSAIQNRKLVGILAPTVAFATCGAIADAQQPAKFLGLRISRAVLFSADSDRIDAFRQGLRDFGYIEGKNIIIESRAADENREPARARSRTE